MFFIEFCEDTFFTGHLWTLLLHRKIVYSVLSKYVWDNIALENYLCNIGPERTAMILKENNLHNFLWSTWAKIAQNNNMYIAETATRGVL